MTNTVIILAAGKGTRMNSRLPKVLQPLAGQSLLSHVLGTVRQLGQQVSLGTPIVVYGHGGKEVQASCAGQPLEWVEQAEQKGTGHAVQMVLPVLPLDGVSLILSGDVPLMGVGTLQRLMDAASSGMAMLSVRLENPTGYGRIVRDAAGQIQRIVEQKDASDAEKQISEINPGVYCVANALLHRLLPRLSNNNAQGEYYLTDIIGTAVAEGIVIGSASPDHEFEIEGVNDKAQLAQLERRWQRHQVDQLLKQGVTVIDPARLDIRGRVTVGKDVLLDVNVILEGECQLGDGVEIGAGSILRNVQLGAGTQVKPYTLMEDVRIGQNAEIGPFARLRPDTVLADETRIGNFVEVKKSTLGTGSKVNHLAYIGDAVIGSQVNVGAGTITCNYDGANKHQTTIEDQAFIGSNSSLVAPIHIGAGATVGAGSVVTKDVPERQLAIARGQQRNTANFTRPVKNK